MFRNLTDYVCFFLFCIRCIYKDCTREHQQDRPLGRKHMPRELTPPHDRRYANRDHLDRYHCAQ